MLTSAVMLFFPHCANIVPPTGGPRDTIPPEVVSSTPVNYATNFTGSEIHIEFDEFIQLRNINQQFIITPPQKESPEFRVRGRDLYIDLNTEPIPNTTYTLNFGDAIVDLNEGNELTNYEFVFSTGDEIDSLSYSGIVLNAFDNKPVEGAIVMLYDELNDSIPYLQMPLYANRTGEDGRFQLNNLRSDTFMVFALTDVNNNYLYDRPGEEAIAFLDDYIFPDTIWKEMPSDTPFLNDTINELMQPGGQTEELPATGQKNLMKYQEQDTTGMIAVRREEGREKDSAQINEIPVQNDEITEKKPEIGFRTGDTLFLFEEKTGRQYLSRNERNQPGELLFVFNRPLKKDWSIEPVNFDPPEGWKLVEKNPLMDSIRYWITDPGIINTEQMRFLVTFWATGPSDSLMQISDTINMNYTQPARSLRRTQEEDTEPTMEIEFGIPGDGNQELHKNLMVRFPVPLSGIDFSKTEFTSVENNEREDRSFELIQDSLRIRNYHLTTDWIPGQDYRFMAEPGAFTDIYGIESDSVDFSFRTREEDHYARIILTLTGIQNNIILQLLDQGDQLLREYFPEEDGEVIIDYLQPANYRLKIIFDTNNNKKWDPGNYLQDIQPERIAIYEEDIATRSNWDIEIHWDLNH